MLLAHIIVFSLIGSIGALIGAGILLALPHLHKRLEAFLLSYAIGTLLGAAFLGLLPHAIQRERPAIVLGVTLAGFVAFFILEKILRIPHPHAHFAGEEHRNETHRTHVQPAAPLILIGDAFHNFVDGVMIAIAFMVSIPLGILTSLAIVAHEIPQELGDFIILVKSGLNRANAYWLNFLSALTTFVGAMLTYSFRSIVEPFTPYFLAISASSFIYIATVDLAPVLHHASGLKSGIRQTAGLLAGVGTIILLHRIAH